MLPVAGEALSAAAALCRASKPAPHVNVSIIPLGGGSGLSVVSLSSPAGGLLAWRRAVRSDAKSDIHVQIHGGCLGGILSGWDEQFELRQASGSKWELRREGGESWILEQPGGPDDRKPIHGIEIKVRRMPAPPSLLQAVSDFGRDVDALKREMRVGITGTRKGVPDKRIERLRKWLAMRAVGRDVILHHGDCVGADAQAHGVAVSLGLKVHIHPPEDSKRRAFRNHWRVDGFERPKPYLERNRDIVDACERLLALPSDPKVEERRSGTWSTVRYARRTGVPVTII